MEEVLLVMVHQADVPIYFFPTVRSRHKTAQFDQVPWKINE